MEGSQTSTDMFNIFSTRQKDTKKASIFVQNLRYKLGDNFNRFPEAEIVSGLTKLLITPIRQYIQCRGWPTTYEKLIREYESTEFSPELEIAQIKKEQTSVNQLIAGPSNLGFLLLEKINKMSARI